MLAHHLCQREQHNIQTQKNRERPRAFGVLYEVTHSTGGCLLLDAPAELALVLGSSAMPPPSRNMVTAISRLLLHASNICFPTLSVAPANKHTHMQRYQQHVLCEVKHKHTGIKPTDALQEVNM